MRPTVGAGISVDNGLLRRMSAHNDATLNDCASTSFCSILLRSNHTENPMAFNFKSLVGGKDVLGHNATDDDGNPAGGFAISSALRRLPGPRPGAAANTSRAVIKIIWQDGPPNRDAGVEPNGAFLEDVLEIVARRLEFYQDSKFSCIENASALGKIRGAIDDLVGRRADRRARGVEGKHER